MTRPRIESDCPGCRPSSRYCALARCYCAHPDCPATYTEQPPPREQP